jgi:ribosomal protein S18 acetylase RimI-like enzyme
MTESTFDLYWIVTHANARGHGVAPSLVRAMETELSKKSSVSIRVETSQTEGYGAARKLYAKLGYPEAARFKDFYKAGDDLIVYYKHIGADD